MLNKRERAEFLELAGTLGRIHYPASLRDVQDAHDVAARLDEIAKPRAWTRAPCTCGTHKVCLRHQVAGAHP